MDPLSQSYGGHGLSVHERHQFQVASSKAQIDEKLASAPQFWGKIFGTERDYMIAVYATTSFGQIRKQFYVYNPALATLDKLSPSTARTAAICADLREPFSGDATKMWKQPENLLKTEKKVDDEAAAVEPAAEEADPNANSVSELDRLSYVLEQIDRDCAVVPRGAHALTAAKNIVPAHDYAGLNSATAQRLQNFCHYRDSDDAQVKARLANALYHFQGDFLDSIAADQPQGAWSVRLDDSQRRVELRSHLWPGYIFAHVLNSKEYAGAYFGQGVKQDDVAFLL